MIISGGGVYRESNTHLGRRQRMTVHFRSYRCVNTHHVVSNMSHFSDPDDFTNENEEAVELAEKWVKGQSDADETVLCALRRAIRYLEEQLHDGRAHLPPHVVLPHLETTKELPLQKLDEHLDNLFYIIKAKVDVTRHKTSHGIERPSKLDLVAKARPDIGRYVESLLQLNLQIDEARTNG